MSIDWLFPKGSYFAKSAERYAIAYQITTPSATSFLGGVFAFIYLTEEVSLKLLSSAMIQLGSSWGKVFFAYLMVALLSCFFMIFVETFDDSGNDHVIEELNVMKEVTAAWILLVNVSRL